jgi:type I restriction-modification system DNA methylase subunit
MLMISQEHITTGLRKNGELLHPAINEQDEIYLFDQEVNPEPWVVSKSALFMKDPSVRDADNLVDGSTLSADKLSGKTFDYLIANPPYGKDWKRDETAERAEHDRGSARRFQPRLPRISDSQLLFLLHMLVHAKAPAEGGSRIAILMNGSPLFFDDAGSGESEIRRFILENDLLEALIALPEQLFYSTCIATYVWVVTNCCRPGPIRATTRESQPACRRSSSVLSPPAPIHEPLVPPLIAAREAACGGVDQGHRARITAGL